MELIDKNELKNLFQKDDDVFTAKDIKHIIDVGIKSKNVTQLYDQVCATLTNFEDVDDRIIRLALGQNGLALYRTLIDVQNFFEE